MGFTIRDIDPQCTFSSAVTVEALSTTARFPYGIMIR
jgi:hypothetical protein